VDVNTVPSSGEGRNNYFCEVREDWSLVGWVNCLCVPASVVPFQVDRRAGIHDQLGRPGDTTVDVAGKVGRVNLIVRSALKTEEGKRRGGEVVPSVIGELEGGGRITTELLLMYWKVACECTAVARARSVARVIFMVSVVMW
jgi:hypothetical protein